MRCVDPSSVDAKEAGYMCVSYAWAKSAKTHPLKFCENDAKAAWEVTSRRADRAFFDKHPLREVELWAWTSRSRVA
ncbi:hypothetical protein ASC90_24845 [Rhizobium sp. Root1220]|nr:hypothetical protein ASC90_24845 [Rhizobium sp. Root1220]